MKQMFEFSSHSFMITEREFDADKHCGVWVQEQQKRCTRSLTCKVIQLKEHIYVLFNKYVRKDS